MVSFLDFTKNNITKSSDVPYVLRPSSETNAQGKGAEGGYDLSLILRADDSLIMRIEKNPEFDHGGVAPTNHSTKVEQQICRGHRIATN
jgi:hypothetical protein